MHAGTGLASQRCHSVSFVSIQPILRRCQIRPVLGNSSAILEWTAQTCCMDAACLHSVTLEAFHATCRCGSTRTHRCFIILAESLQRDTCVSWHRNNIRHQEGLLQQRHPCVRPWYLHCRRIRPGARHRPYRLCRLHGLYTRRDSEEAGCSCSDRGAQTPAHHLCAR